MQISVNTFNKRPSERHMREQNSLFEVGLSAVQKICFMCH